MTEKNLPKTTKGWVMLGYNVLAYLCQQTKCGKTPSESNCKSCIFTKLWESIKFYEEMSWRNLVIMKVCSFKYSYGSLIQYAKETQSVKTKEAKENER